ncbi:MAG: TRAP transporter substrate-binding protein DctP [Marinomonas sp.]|jgi:tripartite ATP-independent transporter DctP family solute receptor|uniref:TRAP transporter substrate-binding protein n=1 Tax=unclassified Marinomonas TaxID=196814 RepID=UPI0005FA244F|nr:MULTISPECIES: TRAP transporter substrate-binding protein DctP [unclassified Marinomonas]KJZ07820.1 C4-dicarboxylate ABC transporter [Marinomonas sp. S3726]KZM43640.1 C4-dicarboxylate ABC transporter [Marinomonas sp. SBI22]KZM47202.1 C4-dicarboxylate ABC transporter [Marinomonas sp. SBI8L]
MKKLLTTLLAMGISMGASAETWKFASEEDKKDVQDIFAQTFAKTIKKESDGDIRVKVYYYGQLGTENDIVELTAKGTVQFVSVGTGHLGSYVPEVQALSVPYVMGTETDVVREVLTGSKTIYEDLADKFERVNLKLLTMISEGEMVWGANKPIRSPEDFAGQKIRTFTSTIPVETYKAFGATPTPLSWGEVYGALQLKTVDGMVNPIYFVYNAKWHEVQDYLMLPGQQPYVGTVSTNSKWFNGLSSEKQAMVRKAIKVAEQAAHDYQLKINAENMKKIMAERPDMQVVTLNADERARFKALSTNLHETYYNVVENAYQGSDKAEARAGAKKILQSLIQEVNDASM